MNEKVKKPIYKRWWVLVIAVVIIGSALAGGPDEEVSEPSEPVNAEIKESDENVLTQNAIDLSVDTITQDEIVSDVAVVIDGDDVSIAIVTNALVDAEKAKQLGDNLVRQLASNSKGTAPTKDDLGSLWNEYNALITVADSAGNTIIEGVKARVSNAIEWE